VGEVVIWDARTHGLAAEGLRPAVDEGDDLRPGFSRRPDTVLCIGQVPEAVDWELVRTWQGMAGGFGGLAGRGFHPARACARDHGRLSLAVVVTIPAGMMRAMAGRGLGGVMAFRVMDTGTGCAVTVGHCAFLPGMRHVIGVGADATMHGLITLDAKIPARCGAGHCLARAHAFVGRGIIGLCHG